MFLVDNPKEMKTKVFLAFYMALVLFTAGCSGPSQQDSGNSGQVVSTTQTTQENQVTTLSDSDAEPVLNTAGKPLSGPEEVQPVAAADAGPVQTEKPAATDSAKSELKSLFAGRVPEYSVSYNSVVSGGGQEHKTRMAYYMNGADRIRIDTIAEGAAAESRFYTLAGKYVMCIRQGPEWTCMNVAGKEQSGTTDPQDDLKKFEEQIDASAVAALPGRVIAGVSTKCYQTTLTVNDSQAKGSGLSSGQYVYCLTSEGVPLYIEASTQTLKMTQEADSYSTKVADSDLIPPAQAKDMREALGVPAPGWQEPAVS